MKRFMFTVLLAFMAINFAKADDFDIVYQRLFDDYLSTNTLQSQTVIQGYMDREQINGSWPDLNYDEHGTLTNWPTNQHWERLLSMAVAYNKTNSFFYGNVALKGKIKSGILYWYNRPVQPYAINWFFNDIGKQITISKLLVLMKSAFTEPDLTNVIYNVVDKYLILPSNFDNYEGTNATWVAGSYLNGAVLKKDETKFKSAVNSIVEQLVVQNQGQVGIQSDNSFQFHGALIYNGGYGNNLIIDISYYMYQCRGLSLIGFTAGQINTLSSLLLEGNQWMMFGKAYDFGVVGRNISRRGSNKSSYLIAVLERMKLIDPPRADQYQTMLGNISDPTGATPGITGNKYFYRSDYMTHRRSKLLIGVRVNSNRTMATESINGENIKGNWLALGSTTIMRTGNEYYDISGSWDWAKIPGVTNPDVEVNWTTRQTSLNTQSLPTAGGVSDGVNGVVGMSLNKVSTNNGVTVDIKAKKAYFLWDNEMVCLGTNIQSAYANAPIITTINQAYLVGYPTVDGVALTTYGEATYKNAKVVYHDNIGYVIRDNAMVKLKEDEQSGNWHDINEGMANQVVTNKVFKLWIDHGTKPTNATYDYAVLPNYTQQQTSDYAANPTSETISNTRDLQAVTQKVLRQTGAVFYTPGELVINSNIKIVVDKPSTILVDWSTSTVKIAVADLNQDQSNLNVTVTFNNLTTEVLNYSLPQGDLKGSSVTKTVTNPGPVTSVLDKSSDRKVVSIFPNPVSDQLSVKGLNKGDVVKLLDLTGKLLKNQLQENTAGLAVVSLQTLSAGTYVLLVESKGKTVYSNKITKK